MTESRSILEKITLMRDSYEYLHKFDYDNVEVLASESPFGKRVFLGMAYIEKNKHHTVNLRTDVDNVNRGYKYLLCNTAK